MMILGSVLLTLLVSFGKGELLDYSSKKQELFVYQQKINIAHDMLVAQCPSYADKLLNRRSVHLHISVARELYNKIIEALVECQKTNQRKTSSTLPTSTEATKAVTETTTSIQSTTTAKLEYRDCQELQENGYNTSGVYNITLPNLPTFSVWCDFFDNRGWTVIQKRFDGSVDFNRMWSEYKSGFGSVLGEYWLGNDKIHALTTYNQKLNVKMALRNRPSHSLFWSHFKVAAEADKYRLEISGYSGDLRDTFASHNGSQFSTKDQDNDIGSSSNCAYTYKGGWWYYNCHNVQLNGKFGSDGTPNIYRGYINGAPDYPATIIMRVTRN